MLWSFLATKKNSLPGRVIFFRTTFLFLTLKEDYKVHRIKLEHH